MKFTPYFESIRNRPDRAIIKNEWILHTLQLPLRVVVQEDGRIRRWSMIAEEGRYLRVVTLADGETVHNAFFERGYRP